MRAIIIESIERETFAELPRVQGGFRQVHAIRSGACREEQRVTHPSLACLVPWRVDVAHGDRIMKIRVTIGGRNGAVGNEQLVTVVSKPLVRYVHDDASARSPSIWTTLAHAVEARTFSVPLPRRSPHAARARAL